MGRRELDVGGVEAYFGCQEGEEGFDGLGGGGKGSVDAFGGDEENAEEVGWLEAVEGLRAQGGWVGERDEAVEGCDGLLNGVFCEGRVLYGQGFRDLG